MSTEDQPEPTEKDLAAQRLIESLGDKSQEELDAVVWQARGARAAFWLMNLAIAGYTPLVVAHLWGWFVVSIVGVAIPVGYLGAAGLCLFVGVLSIGRQPVEVTFEERLKNAATTLVSLPVIHGAGAMLNWLTTL